MHLPQSLPPLDLQRLEHLCRVLDSAAAELSATRTALRARAADLHWHSGAARAFQAVLHDLLGQLGRSGSGIAELSGVVRTHRARAAVRAAAAGRLARSVLEVTERAVRP
jgi:hypothetical protein